MKTLDEHADKLIKEVFLSDEKHIKYLSSPEFEQRKKDKDWEQLKEDTWDWIVDESDSVMVDEYEDEREAWVLKYPDEDEDDYEYSQDAFGFREELMEILLHKLYGVPLDWNNLIFLKILKRVLKLKMAIRDKKSETIKK